MCRKWSAVSDETWSHQSIAVVLAALFTQLSMHTHDMARNSTFQKHMILEQHFDCEPVLENQ